MPQSPDQNVPEVFVLTKKVRTTKRRPQKRPPFFARDDHLTRRDDFDSIFSVGGWPSILTFEGCVFYFLVIPARAFNFSTHFHSRNKPITPGLTPSIPSTSSTPIRIRPSPFE